MPALTSMEQATHLARCSSLKTTTAIAYLSRGDNYLVQVLILNGFGEGGFYKTVTPPGRRILLEF
jgi:hypothetical protein